MSTAVASEQCRGRTGLARTADRHDHLEGGENGMWTSLQGLFLELARRACGEGGQTFVEYALLVVFIALVALLGATLVGQSISSIFSSVAGML
jgi:pilus assembly protein Flp/PilA